jgi:hypothetical protein
MIQQHVELVKVLCDSVYFRQLVCRLNKKHRNSFLPKALVDASHRILNEDAREPCRRRFSESQLTQLETEFGYNHYIPNMRRKSLASQLSVDELAVQRWFQRRRHKYKEQQRMATLLPIAQHFEPLNLLRAIAG